MPPTIALLITVAFVGWLFWRDIRQSPNITAAVWFPLIWLLIMGSRFVSQWLNLSGSYQVVRSTEEGSPIDAFVFFIIILGCVIVLIRRRLRIADVIRNNIFFSAFIVFCLVSVIWSDFPLVAFKRWTKMLGQPMMSLIILTELDPEEALARLMRRAAYFLIPFSVLFIKYFPELGRGFDPWTGAAFNTGVTTDKNALGYVCMVLGFFFVWHLSKTLRHDERINRRQEVAIDLGFLGLIVWLFSMAHSATSLVSTLVGILVMLFLGQRWVNRKLIPYYFLAVLGVIYMGELTFGLSDSFLSFLGKDTTLTGRTEVWDEVLKVPLNPFVGVGYESFWLGERLKHLWDDNWWHPNEAHNGYLEVYLNLGSVGVALVLCLLIASFRRATADLWHKEEWGRFRLGLLIAIILYNFTEAGLRGGTVVFFAFCLVSIDYTSFQFTEEEENADSRTPDEINVLPSNDQTVWLPT